MSAQDHISKKDGQSSISKSSGGRVHERRLFKPSVLIGAPVGEKHHACLRASAGTNTDNYIPRMRCTQGERPHKKMIYI